MSRCNLVVDCGTTNLRVTLLDESLKRLDAVKAEGGVRHTAIDGNNGRLRATLRESMQTVLARNGYAPADVERCVAYGMITSALGLLEIPHVPAPAGASDLRAAMQEKTFEDIAPFPIAFIPGVRNFAGPVDLTNFSEMDMMRGEETEAIGSKRAPCGAAEINSGMFLASLERQEIRGMFFGHEHHIDMQGEYCGITLACASALGYNMSAHDDLRGGRVIDLFEDGNMETYHVKLMDLLGRDAMRDPDYFEGGCPYFIRVLP